MKRKHKHKFSLIDGEEVCECGFIKTEDENRSEGDSTVEQPAFGVTRAHSPDTAMRGTDSTSSVVEKTASRRINISISEEVHSAWSKIKGQKSWNMLLIEALGLHDEVRELKDLIREALVNRPIITQIISERALSQIPTAHESYTKRTYPTPKNRPEFVKELNKLAEKYNDIKEVLLDSEEEAKKDILIDDVKLEQLKEKAIKREMKRRKKHLKPPAGVS